MALIGYMYADSLRFMVGQWGSDDYSHGFFVPVISLLLIWQRRYRVVAAGVRPSWVGPALVFVGLLFYVIGDYGALYVVLHVSLWIVIVGLLLSFIGPFAARQIAFPLAFLLTCIPLPVFLYSALSGRLQLWSSALGIGCLQVAGITAFRDGNVIDLGPVQLQVAEACSGIRYLFPLTSLALLCAYLFRDRIWKRILLVLSAVPISVLVNGLRIGIVGVLVEFFGSQAAEGFLHLFEGWLLFMATLGLLILEMWLLSKIQPLGHSGTFRDRFTWVDEPVQVKTHEVQSQSRLPGNQTSPVYLYSVAVLHVSLWIVIVGLLLSFIGPFAARQIAFPLAFLLTCIPLPVFLYSALSGRLQLWSSALGIGCLQVAGITAFRDGNVIDLGPVQLQVAEACSGIRYLFPLTSLALLCAYLFRDRIWKRILLVLSAVPISVLVNGLRIGIVGVLVEFFGSQAAEGFLHLFEGWLLFMATLGLLILEMWLLSKIQPLGHSGTFRDRFTWVDEPVQVKTHEVQSQSRLPGNKTSPVYLYSVALLIPFAMFSALIGERQEIAPSRPEFLNFPMQIGSWQGNPLPMEQQYISALRFDDYLLADYVSAGEHSVNLYIAYYSSQKKGQSAHSPQSCIPGGGWEIASQQTIELPLGDSVNSAYPANRILIQKDGQKQLVIYWFKQRERILSNEYLVKMFLFWDALLKGRSDGALIRLAAAVNQGQREEDVERQMTEFARLIQPKLTRFIPD